MEQTPAPYGRPYKREIALKREQFHASKPSSSSLRFGVTAQKMVLNYTLTQSLLKGVGYLYITPYPRALMRGWGKLI